MRRSGLRSMRSRLAFAVAALEGGLRETELAAAWDACESTTGVAASTGHKDGMIHLLYNKMQKAVSCGESYDA